ncbi:MAG: c-type cytochrome [Bacteroidota bacterium]
MKKYLVAIALLVFIGACSSNNANDKKTETTATAAAPANDLSSNPDYQKGVELIAKSDCLTCHKTDTKIIGPAYKDVAAKYENTEANVTMLASKIIKGGTGVWGQIPMTPHAALSEADAKALAKYVLLLRK